MKKLKIKDKTFKVIPEARLVQGEMPTKGAEYRDLRRGYKPLCKRIIINCIRAVAPDMYHYDHITHANAYCDEKDTFDERTGIEVCSAKLEMKNHKKMAKAYMRLHNVLIETANIAYGLCMEHADKAKAIEEDLVEHYGRMKV